MPAIDQCEPQVIRAFEKKGWRVRNRAFTLRLTDKRIVFADLRLQLGANLLLIVEVKCFPETRPMIDQLYHAIGQYLIYRAILERENEKTPLYLVIPYDVYAEITTLAIVQSVLHDAKIKIIVVDLVSEEIISWHG